MRKTILFIVILFVVSFSISAKKKEKVANINSAMNSEILSTDSASCDSDFIFPMVSVGNVVFSTDEKVKDAKSDENNPIDSVLFKGMSKKEIVEFFVQNVVYPTELKQKAAEESLKIRFDVDKNGKVKNPKVLNSKYPEMEKEALRVVGKLPEYGPDSTLISENEKPKKERKKSKEKDTTVEVPISFRLLRL